MTEGGPSIGEVQPLRGRERFSQWARETFTLEGRTDYRMRNNLAKVHETLEQLPPEERIAKMEELYEVSRSAAVKSVVRDVAIIVGAAGAGAGGLAYWKRDRLAGALYDAAGGIDKMGQGVRKAMEGVSSRAQDLRDSLGERTTRMGTHFQKAVVEARARKRRETPVVSELVDALSGAIKLNALDALDTSHPVAGLLGGSTLTEFGGSELNNMEAESFADDLVNLAKRFGRWVPMVFGKDTAPYGLHTTQGHPVEGMGLLIQKGLVTMKELSDGKKLLAPTEAFVEFVKKHVVE